MNNKSSEFPSFCCYKYILNNNGITFELRTNKKHNNMKKLCTLLLLAVTLISTAQESTLLRLKYNKGDQYLVKMAINQDMGGGAMLVNMGMDMKIDVKDAKDGVYDTEMSFARMSMDMNGQGMNVKVATDSKDEDLDEQGKMMKVQMAPALEMVIGAKVDDRGKTSDMKIIKGTGDIEQFKQSNNSVEYPEKAVKVGDTWVEEKENKGMIMKYTYKVESITSSDVILAVGGEVSGAATGTFKGKMDINRDNGIPKDGEIKMDFQMMGQEVKMNINFTYEKQ